MSETPHQSIDGRAATRLRSVLLQPLTEGCVQGLMSRLGYQSRLLD